MSIQDIGNKIKGVYKENPNILPISAIIALVGLGCFLLGRLSVNMSTPNSKVTILDTKTNLPIDIAKKSTDKPVLVANVGEIDAGNGAQGMYVASKNGKLYYTRDCKAVSRLSEKTKISWNTKEEAENAGYTFAESCNK